MLLIMASSAATGLPTALRMIQEVNSVTCRGWDDRFLSVFHGFLAIGGVLWLLMLAWPVFRQPRRWWATEPFARSMLAALVAVAPTLAMGALSRTAFFLSMLRIPLTYMTECPDVDFGGLGFLHRFAVESPAVLEQTTMLVIAGVFFLVLATLGGLLTHLLARFGSPWRLPRPSTSA